MTTWTIVCATGPRPQHLTQDQRRWVREKLRRAAEWCRDERGTKVGISGFALGVDLWWADAVVQAGLVLGAYVPCPPNPRWSSGDRAEYQRLLALADPTYSHPGADLYSPEVMQERNERMLGRSDAALCVWLPHRRHGGTWNAIRSAYALGMDGVHLNLAEQRVRLGLPPLTEARAA